MSPRDSDAPAPPPAGSEPPVARLRAVSLRHGKTVALERITLDLPAGRIIGVIGPDGVGKSTLLSLIAGARKVQQGRVEVLGGDMADPAHRRTVCPRIAFMPQGLGRNLYATLSVTENLDFFARLFGQAAGERRARIENLLAATGLSAFRDRPAGKLSGGMKQKLGLCCALIHDPDLLVLDEPTTGVDPLSRVQFWELIGRIRRAHQGMSVIVATAYMEEAAGFDLLVAMNAGRLLSIGTTTELLARTGARTLEDAFIAMMPAAERKSHHAVVIAARPAGIAADVVIEARGLTMRFGDFTAVDHVDLSIARGEIFGFLGSNGCGKTTTMKMLTGLLAASSGEAWLFGERVTGGNLAVRRRVGYMSQGFSLYSELSVRQNLILQARLFALPRPVAAARVSEMLQRFELAQVSDAMPDDLPLGVRQRLSLAVAMVHSPDLLILDEPTSGVDPIARDMFWQMMADLSRDDNVTIFISTHFMNEASRCDRISLMNAGRVLVCDTPAAVTASRQAKTLEDAFIGYLRDANETKTDTAGSSVPRPGRGAAATASGFSLRRMWSYTLRETLELARDPIRGTLALFGTVMLMLILGYGLNLDVNNVRFAVLDSDNSGLSRDYALNLAGSRYFVQQAPITDTAALDRRMRSGELSLAIELPPGFGRDLDRGTPVAVGVWIDGANPQRGETIQSYVQAMHMEWLAGMARARLGLRVSFASVNVQIRFRYNADVVSVVAMVPAMIPLLLLLIPAMLTALSVVREKELGSIINLYVTPVTRSEFLIGKQIPYVALGMVNFLLLTILATVAFGVTLSGSLGFLSLAALVFILSSTGTGLVMSTFTRSQAAAILATTIGTLVPAIQYGGLINPVSSLTGVGALIGRMLPVTYFLVIARGAFSKALGLATLWPDLLPIATSVVVLMVLCILLLKKQES